MELALTGEEGRYGGSSGSLQGTNTYVCVSEEGWVWRGYAPQKAGMGTGELWEGES